MNPQTCNVKVVSNINLLKLIIKFHCWAVVENTFRSTVFLNAKSLISHEFMAFLNKTVAEESSVISESEIEPGYKSLNINHPPCGQHQCML